MDVAEKCPDQTRNLNPTPEAVLARAIWHKEYGPFGGGTMDFWDSLPESRKLTARKVLEEILAAASN